MAKTPVPVPRRGHRLLHACAWGLVTFLLADVACRVLLPGGTLAQEEEFIRRRAESQLAPDIQIVGDSVARSGLLGAALAQGGLRTRNDSVSGGGINKTYYLLKAQFESGRVPSALVIAHAPHTFHQARFETLVGSFARWPEIPAIARDSGQWTGVLYGLFARTSYILRHRDRFRSLVLEADTSFFTNYQDYEHVLDDVLRVENFLAELAHGTVATTQAPDLDPDFFARPFQVDPVNHRYLRKTLELARQHGVPVFWLSMPVPLSGHQARTRTGYETAFREYLRQFEEEGHFSILSSTFPAYPDQMFRDDVHMAETGSMRFACENRSFSRQISEAALAGGKARLRSVAHADAVATQAGQVLLDRVCASR